MTLFSVEKRNKTLIGNIATLMGGTAFGRLITILAAPVLARLFNPDVFGVAALLIAIAIVLNSVSSLRYEHAIILPPDQDQAVALSRLSLAILMVFCALLAVLLWLLLQLGWALFWLSTLGTWSIIIPGVVFLLGVDNILRRWAVREKRFKAMATGSAGNSVVTAGVRIGLGAAFGSTVGGLVGGYFMGIATELWMIVRSLGMRPSAIVRGACGSSMRAVALRYRDFAFFSSPTALLKAMSDQLPVLLLGAMFSPAVVGFYAIAHRLVRMPVRVVGQSASTVYLQRATEIHNSGGSIGPGLVKVTIGLALMGAPVFIALFVWGEELFGLLLGERWSMGGRFSEVLAPLLYTILIFSPSNAVFVVLERQRLLLWLQLLRTLAAAMAFVLGALWQWEALDTLELYGALGVTINMVTAAAAFYLSCGNKAAVVSKTDQVP